MAKEANATPVPAKDEAPAPVETGTFKLTYRPLFDGDKSRAVWNGHVFNANEPKELPLTASISTDKGPIRMFDLAKGNTHFDVHDEKGTLVKKAGIAKLGTPKTTEQYVAYAVKWINESDELGGFLRRWEREEEMRDRLGVGTDDIDLIKRHYDTALHRLKQASKATSLQTA